MKTITVDGRTLTMAQWAKEVGLKNGTIQQRLKKGWSIEEALTPSHFKGERHSFQGKMMTIAQISLITNVAPTTIRARLKLGSTVERAVSQLVWGRPQGPKPVVIKKPRPKVKSPPLPVNAPEHEYYYANLISSGATEAEATRSTLDYMRTINR
tara:strand:+ start:34929 stop:35390 length:462 start_codon:yes stop_codon:yes gene_type:complete